ncbi:hypothetical protein GH714_008233 [Hevea brasiliensis]|uniref:histidine kinase n=1 Tax=Hevea brasiliensis TaxID=3981 RepID=A0A6A6LWJ2_HEVBR|nr:hypothetical protein GH714_008233 [Hevea brasiliensis]
MPFAEETMRAKQMLANQSHETRSPLSGVVGMAEILSATNLDREQRQLLNVMISSGDLVIGDVLRIRQILTNLISNAIKFTHEGKVGINLYVVPDPCFGKAEGNHQKSSAVQSTTNASKEEKCTSASQINNDLNGSHTPRQNHAHDDEPITPVRTGNAADGDSRRNHTITGNSSVATL